MSHQLARRTGTVGALVAAASMTMVAGVWPAAGMASAADVPPGQVKQDGASGTDTAPGQVKKDAEPVVGPVAEPVAEAPQADAPGQVKKEEGAPAPQDAAPGQVAKAAPAEEPVTAVQEPVTTVQEPVTTVQEPVTTVQEPVTTVQEPTTTVVPAPVQEPTTTVEPAPAQEPVVGPVTGVEKKNERPVKEEKITKQVGPPTGLGPEAKAAPAPAADKAPRKAEAPATDAPVLGPVRAPAEQPRKDKRVPVGPTTGLAPAPEKAPAEPQAPKTVKPVKVGPAVPVAVVAPARTSTAAEGVTAAPASAPVDRRTLPVVSTPVRQPSRQFRVAAADPLPLRPVGSDPIVLPEPARMEIVEVDLAHALPGLAAGTVEAVARTPELPLGIAAVVVLFLLVQGRIDRRDPKLADDPVEDDQPLEFFPPQLHLRLVTAA